MKILCVVKFVPCVGSPAVGTDSHSPSGLVLNPDDACALAFALGVKANAPSCRVEAVTMGPLSVRPHMEDLLRRRIDRAALICDPVFDGSDPLVVSDVLGRYIGARRFDCILTGTQSTDRNASQVPAQLAEHLDLEHLQGITRIDPDRFDSRRAVFEVMEEKGIATYEMAMPGILGLTRESGYTLPYLRAKEMRQDLSGAVKIVTASALGVFQTGPGPAGPFTRTIKVSSNTCEKRDGNLFVNCEDGAAAVFEFLKRKGFL